MTGPSDGAATSWWDAPGVGPWDRRAAAARAGLVLALLACGAFPVALLVVRARVADALTFRFLVWNLFLAGLPVLFALGADWAWRSRRRILGTASLVLWLLFFPNSPYLVTDLVHLTERPPTPLWFDALILASAGVAGLLAGFASLRLVHVLAARAVGAAWAWVGALALLALCGFGVYLGRFGRFNSWDVLTSPRNLLYGTTATFGDPLGSKQAVAVTLLFSGFLIVGYLVVTAIGWLGGGPGGGPGGGRR